MRRWHVGIVSAALLAIACIAASAQSINPGLGSCYGNDVPPGLVALLDPVTGKCYIELGAPGAPGVVSDNFEGTKASYSATSIGLVPAASATDLFCISPAATKTIRIGRIEVSATAGTAAQLDMVVLRRSTLDTAGTAATSTANPANTIALHDPVNDPAATATLIAYTANPTTGTAAGIVRSAKIAAVTTSTAAGGTLQAWDFGTRLAKMMVLAKNTTQQACVNMNAGSLTTGSIDINIEWTEE